jgi:hypothetical protein
VNLELWAGLNIEREVISRYIMGKIMGDVVHDRYATAWIVPDPCRPHTSPCLGLGTLGRSRSPVRIFSKSQSPDLNG